MGELNIPSDEQKAIKAIDTAALSKLIEQCLYQERPDALRSLRLENCGLYVGSRLRTFEKALAEHGKARAPKKRAETEYHARRAGSDLAHAVQQMKSRVETEEKEGQLFYVDDHIVPPYRFSDRLTVPVSYRWRRTIEDEWIYGSIVFFHDFESRPDYTTPLPKRKPSAARREQERQDELYRAWEYLKILALQSLREYFRRGGDGAEIPETFQAKTDSYSRGLNNYSAQFWATER